MLLVFPGTVYKNSLMVSILGGAKALYTNYELRLLGKGHKANALGVWAENKLTVKTTIITVFVVD